MELFESYDRRIDKILGVLKEYGIGSVSERAALLRRCETEGIGVSVRKPFHGGKLLAAETSPFHESVVSSRTEPRRFSKSTMNAVDLVSA